MFASNFPSLLSRAVAVSSHCGAISFNATSAENGKRSPSTHDDFADLNDRSLVGVVWNVSHDLLRVWTEPSLKSLN